MKRPSQPPPPSRKLSCSSGTVLCAVDQAVKTTADLRSCGWPERGMAFKNLTPKKTTWSRVRIRRVSVVFLSICGRGTWPLSTKKKSTKTIFLTSCLWMDMDLGYPPSKGQGQGDHCVLKSKALGNIECQIIIHDSCPEKWNMVGGSEETIQTPKRSGSFHTRSKFTTSPKMSKRRIFNRTIKLIRNERAMF